MPSRSRSSANCPVACPVARVSCKLSARLSILRVSGNMTTAFEIPSTASSIRFSGTPAASRLETASTLESASVLSVFSRLNASEVTSRPIPAFTAFCWRRDRSPRSSSVESNRPVTNPEIASKAKLAIMASLMPDRESFTSLRSSFTFRLLFPDFLETLSNSSP